MLDDSIKDEGVTEPDYTAERHYQWAMGLLAKSNGLLPGQTEQIPILLEAIAHALLGGLRDGLDYAARKVPPASGGGYAAPLFEEDDDRP